MTWNNRTAIKKKAQGFYKCNHSNLAILSTWTEHMAITPTRLAAALLSFCVCETHFINGMTMKLEDIQNVYKVLIEKWKRVYNFSKFMNKATELWAGYGLTGSNLYYSAFCDFLEFLNSLVSVSSCLKYI